MSNQYQNLIEKLDEQQLEVVTTSSKNSVVLAGAGSGKTHTLILRVSYLINELKIDPSRILCLTFTNNAANEMESRYVQYSDNSTIPLICTFHKFCYQILCENEEILHALDYNQVPRIIDEIEENSVHTKIQMMTSTKLPKAARQLSYEPKLNEKFDYKIYHKTLKKYLIEENQITFDYLCSKICDLFISKSTIIQKYLNHYDYIFVDEFQDTDPYQYKFIESFKNNSNIMLIGDVRQNIYSFRGCTNKILKELIKDNNWDIYKLEHNYRSTIEICDYANRFVTRYKDNIPSLNLSSKIHGPSLRHTEEKYIDTVLNDISKSDYETTAILARTNKEVDYLCGKLKNLHIKFSQKSQYDKVRQLLASIDSKFYEEYFISLLNQKEKYAVLRKMHLDITYNPLPELELLFHDKVKEIEDIRNSEEFGQLQYLYQHQQLNLSDISSQRSKIFKSSLYVGTIHSVKGLEFDSVYVYGVNSKRFPIKGEDNMNLYYVAITRPKKLLTIITE